MLFSLDLNLSSMSWFVFFLFSLFIEGYLFYSKKCCSSISNVICCDINCLACSLETLLSKSISRGRIYTSLQSYIWYIKTNKLTKNNDEFLFFVPSSSSWFFYVIMLNSLMVNLIKTNKKTKRVFSCKFFLSLYSSKEKNLLIFVSFCAIFLCVFIFAAFVSLSNNTCLFSSSLNLLMSFAFFFQKQQKRKREKLFYLSLSLCKTFDTSFCW